MKPNGSNTKFKLFAVCPPGIEDILSLELSSLGIKGRKVAGGVEFSGDLFTIYSVNLWSRVASRILLRVGNFRLLSLKEATDRFSRYPWELYIPDSTDIRIRATAHKSRIYHSGALKQRLLEGISRRLGHPIRLASERAGRNCPLLLVRMFRDRCQVSVDSSGEHLHKRGLKKFTVRAPLRENLAAAMLLASGWDRASDLVDPFCGSGTIIIEAVLMACMIPPGRRRKFAFMKWKNFDQGLWKHLLRRSDRLAIEPTGSIIGLDKDPAAVETSILNLEYAGLIPFARIIQEDVSCLERHCRSERGFIVTNPPYGQRLKENYSLTDLFATFGRIVKKRLPGWKLTLLCPQNPPSLRRSLGLSLDSRYRFLNGGLKVELLSSAID